MMELILLLYVQKKNFGSKMYTEELNYLLNANSEDLIDLQVFLVPGGREDT